ncbi:hypothetical protein DB313_04770 (plasmid) [Borrelia turcica IST7]|uniref:Mlp family lipoprotein n=1 Tax=Borrelia turcica IST7 TaxID=1104446 RepID=A0A386PNW9_9SPIR|nr:Mlp family lipoprotein [Borrelia turcica]AYE36815.1 hypothetical protein DB313_04770 [Borrelia turcica IST7]
MGRMKYIVVFLLLLVSCKQYSEEIGDKGKDNPQDKSESEVSEEGQEEVKKTVEEALREKLSDTQKASLDFLKEALNDEGKFNKLLGMDEGKVKGALDHIQQELESCTGENVSSGKETFKKVVEGALGSSIDLNSFKNQAVSGCDANGGG